MITFQSVSKYYPTRFGPHYVFRDVNLTLPRDRNVGVIGPNGAGKSTLLRLVAGTDTPSAGRIARTGRVSWPIGLTAGLQRTLTGRENARFAARVYGLERAAAKAMLEQVADIAGIGKHFDLPAETYSAGMRQRVSFAITMSLEFDYYIFDEISAGGDRSFAAQAQTLIAGRLAQARFILASHNLSEIRRLCQACILIQGGTLTYFDNVAEALAAYRTPSGPTARQGLDAAAGLRQKHDELALQESRLMDLVARQANRNGRAAAERLLENTRRQMTEAARQLEAATAAGTNG